MIDLGDDRRARRQRQHERYLRRIGAEAAEEERRIAERMKHPRPFTRQDAIDLLVLGVYGYLWVSMWL